MSRDSKSSKSNFSLSSTVGVLALAAAASAIGGIVGYFAGREEEKSSNSQNSRVRLPVAMPANSLGQNEPPSRDSPIPSDFPSNCSDSSDSPACKICFDSPQSIVFLPCRHLIACARCSAQCKICPICQGQIVDSMPIYPS